jgi:flagellar protein FlbD
MMFDSLLIEVTLKLMIEVSRINGKKYVINCELIKTIEATPDTVITLLSGEKLMVKDSVEEVVRMTMNYRKRLYQEPPSTTGG